ncbi:Clavaminate synthase-like protein [Stereum hirsutum FP-91666 SS1]|uniref:Clavaminate synthase-like protein n=1 Tax=Stereum hirsutum (strain FP-91666) TaxID=721885 RepID=UPI0004449E81|nr:Clavaminate synthase-like protein [Stereum hirsutum FP-91666 SS1]EIM85642.1 Clavaminate synthase-like protein [Stereum hirsutum FP-91666 SS1]
MPRLASRINFNLHTTCLSAMMSVIHHGSLSSQKLYPILPRVILNRRLPHIRRQSTSPVPQRTGSYVHWAPLPVLSDPSLSTFLDQALDPHLPHILPRGLFANYPAIKEWFIPVAPSANPGNASPSSSSHPPIPQPILHLNTDYLSRYSDTTVSLELTTTRVSDGTIEDFERVDAPLSLFLQYIELAGRNMDTGTHRYSIYLAQSSLSSLPPELLASLPKPEFVISSYTSPPSSTTLTSSPRLSGNPGDNIYGSSLWLGLALTETPLHRDPNHGLLMMLAGRKRIRVVSPRVGKDIFDTVKARTITRSSMDGHDGGRGRVRGKEMMIGDEREGLDEIVWGPQDGRSGKSWEGFDGVLDVGDAVFLPMGWWHSLKGVGEGMVGSVNWWFR